MAAMLEAGGQFPSVELNVAGGGSIRLPDDLSSNLTVVLFYRGHW